MSFSSLLSPKSFLLGVDVDFDAVDEIKSSLRALAIEKHRRISDHFAKLTAIRR
jgi:hypothetical protein